MTNIELADLIEKFLNGTSETWGWDDFISIKQSDPEIEKIRIDCIQLPFRFPSFKANEYCGQEGISLLKRYVQSLRAK